jgi:hypothetical protein
MQIIDFFVIFCYNIITVYQSKGYIMAEYLLVHTVEWTVKDSSASGRKSHHDVIKSESFGTSDQIYNHSWELLCAEARDEAKPPSRFDGFDPNKVEIHTLHFSLTPIQL